MATAPGTPASGSQAARKAPAGPRLGAMAALLRKPLLIRAGISLVDLEKRFDGADTTLQIGHCCAQKAVLVTASGSGGQPLGGDPPQVVFGKLQRSRQVGQRGAVAGLLVAVLDLPQRGRRKARSLGQFSLRHAASCHPVVDDRGDIGPVSQRGLLSTLAPIVLTAGYRIMCAIDSAINNAKIALLIARSTVRAVLDERGAPR